MKSITNLVKQEEKLRKEALKYSEKLTEVNRSLTKLIELDIPGLMDEVDLKLLKLKSGVTVEIKTDVYVSISGPNKKKAFAWLKKNNFDGIIKNLIVVEMGKGMTKETERIMKALDKTTSKMEVFPEQKESVHAATLKAFVKERITESKKFPRSIFGVHEKNVAKIKKGGNK